MRMKISVQNVCPKCGKLQTVKVEQSQYHRWMAGENIQKAMPNLTPNEREVLLSGICPECWEKIFPSENEEETQEESEYNEFGIDIRTGEPFPKPNIN